MWALFDWVGFLMVLVHLDDLRLRLPTRRSYVHGLHFIHAPIPRVASLPTLTRTCTDFIFIHAPILRVTPGRWRTSPGPASFFSHCSFGPSAVTGTSSHLGPRLDSESGDRMPHVQLFLHRVSSPAPLSCRGGWVSTRDLPSLSSMTPRRLLAFWLASTYVAHSPRLLTARTHPSPKAVLPESDRHEHESAEEGESVLQVWQARP